MRVLVDENIPRMTVDSLRVLGHDVKDVRGSSHQSLGDSDLWALALAESRALITTDKGFTQHRSVPHHGILIVRLRQPNRQRIHQAVMHGYRALSGCGMAELACGRPGYHYEHLKGGWRQEYGPA